MTHHNDRQVTVSCVGQCLQPSKRKREIRVRKKAGLCNDRRLKVTKSDSRVYGVVSVHFLPVSSALGFSFSLPKTLSRLYIKTLAPKYSFTHRRYIYIYIFYFLIFLFLIWISAPKFLIFLLSASAFNYHESFLLF